MKCRNCGNIQLEEPPQGLLIPPKILYFDIETALMKVTTFQTGKQYVMWKQVNQDSFVLCWGAAWMNKEPLKIMSDCVTPKEAIKHDDERCLIRLWELMDFADYIVGHNMRSFDWKFVSARFIQFGWSSPFDTKIVDTYLLSKRKFRVPSHAMDAWSRRLGNGQKAHMEREDWERCLVGDESALHKMLRYCKGDIKDGVKLTRQFQTYIESGGGKPLFR